MAIVSLPYTLPDLDGYEVFMLVLALVTSLYAVPQVIHIYRVHSARDVSVVTWAVAVFSDVAWVIYGLMIQDLVVMLSSLMGGVVAAVLTVQVVYYHRRERRGGYAAVPSPGRSKQLRAIVRRIHAATAPPLSDSSIAALQPKLLGLMQDVAG